MTSDSVRAPRSWTPRPVYRLSIIIALVLLVLLTLSPYKPELPKPSSFFGGQSNMDSRCSPHDWNDGAWVRNPNAKPIQSPIDVYAASGFSGCASTREVTLHMGTDKLDKLHWRQNISSWTWTPNGGKCLDVARTGLGEDLLIDLVQRGGWLLVGDSVTQEHFFSLSCILHPHVIATPDQSRGYDHAWAQNLWLHPDSPLISKIQFPPGFDKQKTPLVTFRRNDLLFNHTEVETLFNGGGWRPGPNETTRLFGEERAWTLSPTEYLSIFLAPAPFNYRVLVVSTAGHWSLHLLTGLGGGYPEIADFFRVVMQNFVYQAGRALDSMDGTGKEIIVRPYLSGDPGCHDEDIMNGGPLTMPLDLSKAPFNWQWIPRMNGIFEEAVAARAHPSLHYLGIDWPGRLRPGTHIHNDCLHLVVGTGVIEGWTQYIHYFVSTYLPWKRSLEETPPDFAKN